LSILLFFFGVERGFATPLVCTVCSVGIASGLGMAKLLGVSENIIALWFGGALLAIGSGSVYYLAEKRKVKNWLLKATAFLSSYLLLIAPYIGKVPSVIFNQNKTLFVDSFMFFTLLGSVVVFICEEYYRYIKSKRGKPHFQFEKVVLPLGGLVISSLVINFL
jgi:hypothetical protein